MKVKDSNLFELKCAVFDLFKKVKTTTLTFLDFFERYE